MNRRDLLLGLVGVTVAAPLIRATTREDGVELYSIPHPDLSQPSLDRLMTSGYAQTNLRSDQELANTDTVTLYTTEEDWLDLVFTNVHPELAQGHIHVELLP